MESKEKGALLEIFHRQKTLFLSGITRDNTFKKNQLGKLKNALLGHKEEIYRAMWADLGRSEAGVEQAEIAPLMNEINYAISHLDEWSVEKKVPTPPPLGNSESYITREGYGVNYIIGPFNYPLFLSFCPLIGAIVGGNTAIIKPSEATPAASAVIEKIINRTFEPDYIHVCQGAKEENEFLLTLPFNLIFFTGSPLVGKVVMAAAAKHLTPVLLEMGGKCPAIVLEDADPEVVVAELVASKMINSGQTCVAPDYLYIDRRFKPQIVSQLCTALNSRFGVAGSHGRIVSNAAYTRLEKILASSDGKIVWRGASDKAQRFFGAAIVDNVSFHDSTMQQELFGPIFPVLTFDSEQEIATLINTYHPQPLAAYVFSRDTDRARALIDTIPSGDAGINALLLHAASPYLPFGGVGVSGMGCYHGEYSYQAFTHPKSLRVKKTG